MFDFFRFQDTMVFDGTLFYPYIAFRVGVSSEFVLEGPFQSEFTSQIPGAMSNGTLTIDPVIESSIAVPLYALGYPQVPFVSGSFVSGSAAISMQAIEFFPGQNRLGQQVFNTSTGAEIADPFA